MNKNIESSSNKGFVGKLIERLKSIFSKKEEQKYLTDGRSSSSIKNKNKNFLKSIKFDPNDPDALLKACTPENYIQNILKSLGVPQEFINNPAFAGALETVIEKNKIDINLDNIDNASKFQEIRDDLSQCIIVSNGKVGLAYQDFKSKLDYERSTKTDFKLYGNTFAEYAEDITKNRDNNNLDKLKDELNQKLIKELGIFSGDELDYKELNDYLDKIKVNQEQKNAFLSLKSNVDILEMKLKQPPTTYMEFSKNSGAEIKLVETCRKGDNSKFKYTSNTSIFDSNGILQSLERDESKIKRTKGFEYLVEEGVMYDTGSNNKKIEQGGTIKFFTKKRDWYDMRVLSELYEYYDKYEPPYFKSIYEKQKRANQSLAKESGIDLSRSDKSNNSKEL